MRSLNRSFPMSSNGSKPQKDGGQKLEFRKRGSTLFKRQVGVRRPGSSRWISFLTKCMPIYGAVCMFLILFYIIWRGL